MVSAKTFAVVFLALVSGCLTDSTPKEVHQTLDPENGLDRGDWGPVDLCPDGTTVDSFEFKYDSPGNVDDEAGTGIKLYCTNSVGEVSYVTSAEGLYGSWQGIRRCSSDNTYLDGVRMEVLPPQGNFGDDLGVTNIQFLCNGTGEVLTGNSGFKEMESQKSRAMAREVSRGFIERNGRKYEQISMALPPQTREGPSYGVWLTCTSGYSICGLQTRVEEDTVVTDDASLSDALFFCC